MIKFLLSFVLITNIAIAQEEDLKTLVGEDFTSGFIAAFDYKALVDEGSVTNLIGVHGGWLINHKFLLGAAGYGNIGDDDFGYGGALVEYFFNPNDAINYSIRSLVGVGGRDSPARHFSATSCGQDQFCIDNDHNNFFVVEPEARLMLNVIDPLRVAFGVGYRFSGNEGIDGPTFNFSVNFGIF